MNGELDFEQALRTRVALIKGLERHVIEEVRRERITLAPGGRALVQTMKAFGAYTSLVSGGFTFFADYFGKRIGFDEAIANVLEFDGDSADRHGRRAHRRQVHQAQSAARRWPPSSDVPLAADHGRRRRRQRPRHDQGRRALASRCTPSRMSRPRRRSASTTPT